MANAAAVALAAGIGAWLAATLDFGHPGGMSPLGAAAATALVAAAASGVVHGFLLRRAFAPLRDLARVAARLQAEGPDAEHLRVTIRPTSDRNLADLTRVFNGMLDTLSRYRARLRRLAARTLETAEEERRLVARRLQEDTAQHLASLIVRLELVRKCEDPVERDAVLDELRQEAADTLESVRRTARDLYPPELGDVGLEQALRAYARTLRNGDRGKEPRVEFDLWGREAEMGESCRLALYRILQEALTNAYVHAEADRIRVEFRRSGDTLQAAVRDDGKGMPAGTADTGRESLGLLSMRERAANAGGRLDIVSRPGGGTAVIVELPLVCIDSADALESEQDGGAEG